VIEPSAEVETGPAPSTAASPLGDHDPHLGAIVVAEKDLKRRVAELGEQITSDYRARPPLLVGVLKGACFFLSDLARHIHLPVELDFMAVSSYGSATRTSGVVRIVKDLDLDLTDKHVLIVEDIVDSGLTLSYLRRNLAARNPASLEVVALLVKDGLQSVDPRLAYEGFRIPPEFVVGYGLDVAERYRNLPYIAAYIEGGEGDDGKADAAPNGAGTTLVTP
jgi:hypoxanthine phosphoribosyltransferase